MSKGGGSSLYNPFTPWSVGSHGNGEQQRGKAKREMGGGEREREKGDGERWGEDRKREEKRERCAKRAGSGEKGEKEREREILLPHSITASLPLTS